MFKDKSFNRGLIYSFRVLVHYYYDVEHGGTQADMALEK